MNAISLEGVTRSFGRKQVLRGVNAAAGQGKVVGLLGRNGEGKSTLFKILLDILAADSGRVEVLGMRPDATGAIRRLTGYVPERPAFHDFMDIGEVLELRSRFFPSWNREKASSLARRLGLELDAPVKGASKGTIGKLAWVCAVAHDPALYLLDEPTSGLDALVREDLLGDLIGELHESGKTFLIANHRMEELSGLLDEIWLLRDGVVAAVHDAEVLRTQARLIVGRRVPGAAIPPDARAVSLTSESPLAEFAVFDAASENALLASGLLTDAVTRPLPFETTLKHLLTNPGGAS